MVIRHVERPGERRAALWIAGLTALVLAVLWTASLVNAVQVRQRTLEQEKRALERLCSLVEVQTRHMFKLVEFFMAAADQWIETHPGINPRTDPEFLRLVDNLEQLAPNRIRARVIDESGQVFEVPLHDRRATASAADRDVFIAQQHAGTTGFFIGKPMIGQLTHRWVLPVSYPLRRPTMKFTILVAAIELADLERVYETVRVKPNGAIVLLNRDGTVLARGPIDESLLGKSVAKGKIWREGLPKATRGTMLLESTATDNIPKLAAYASLDDYPLVVVVSSGLDDALATWRYDTAIDFAFMALFTLAAFFVSRHLIHQLEQLSRTRSRLEQQANIDPLTGIGNRRQFFALGHAEFARLQRHPRPLALLLLDLDHFKRVNDNHGHTVGDDALAQFASTVRGNLRTIDIFGRIGGEEFAVLLPETGGSDAMELAQRIRSAVGQTRIHSGEVNLAITVSIGVAEVDDGVWDLETLMSRADESLYRAKALGRDRVVSWEDARGETHLAPATDSG
jgi:diguanylate cyclase (GGDEF)-like protein